MSVPEGESVDTPLHSRSNSCQRILVVDGEPDICQLSTEVLVQSGYEVDAVADGTAAWEALAADKYDLVIADNLMPGLTALGLLKKLYADRMSLPVIMAAETLPDQEFRQHPWLQPAATLIKPYTTEEMLMKVKEVLHESNVTASGSQVMVPLQVTSSRMAPADKSAGVPAQNPKVYPHHILVVDDNSDIRQLSVDVLADAGYHVEAVKDGAAGWEALQTNRFDLVVTDNKMPRMTGIEMIGKLRSASMTVPVLMATSFFPMNDIARRPWLKPEAMLQRPCSNDDLLGAVNQLLRPEPGNDNHKSTPAPIAF